MMIRYFDRYGRLVYMEPVHNLTRDRLDILRLIAKYDAATIQANGRIYSADDIYHGRNGKPVEVTS